MTTPQTTPTDEQLWELRRQAKDDPRCADTHWFILFARAAIAASQGVTAAPQEGVRVRHADRGVSDITTDTDNPLLTPVAPESPQPLAPPPGWKLVPIEPTNEMNLAGDTYATQTADRPKGVWWWGRVFQAMLAAAPQPPASALPLAVGVETERLMKFYQVDTVEALVKAQNGHIEKLQAKLPRDTQPAFQRLREG